MLDDIGIPSGSFNLAFGDGSLTDVQDGEILVSLNENHHPTAGVPARSCARCCMRSFRM